MRWTTTAILAVLLAGLATFFYVYDVRQGPAREKATAEKDRAWKGFEWGDVDGVTITRKSDTLQLKKAADGWQLAAPVQSRAETQPVQELVTSLATLRVEREIEANPSKLGDFGLETPAADIQFTAKGQSHRVRVGGKNPTGLWAYAQLEDKPAVVLVPDSLLRDAQKPVSDFRDRTVLAFERGAVKAVEVKSPAGAAVTAERKGSDDWQLAGPAAVGADREQISGLLEKLRAAKIKEFVAEPPKGPDPYGLDRPLALTPWMGEEKDRAARTLGLGKTIADKKTVYAQREGDATVFTVDEELVKAIPTSAAALRDKTLFAYDRSKLERVELESPKGKVALATEGGAWKITAPASLKVDDSAMGDLLSKARDLRAKEFVAEDHKQLARYGLDQPTVRLSVWEKDAKEPKSLLVAAIKGKDQAYATVTGGATPHPVVLVDAKAVTDLAKSAQDLRDRTVLGAFDVQTVTRVEIKRKDATLVLERKGDTDWQLVAPRQGKAQAGRVSDFLWTLRSLR